MSSGAWVERTDPKSGRVFYFNPSTRETRWDKPKDVVETGAASEDDDVSNWLSRKDPKSGRTYYYHRVTKETRWDPPPGWKDPEISASKSSDLGRVAEDTFSEDVPNHLPVAPVNVQSARKSIHLGALGAGGLDKFAKLRALASSKGLAAADEFLNSAGDSGNNNRADNAGVDTTVSEDDRADPEDSLDLEKLAAELSVGVGNQRMDDYAAKFFNLKRKGMFGKQTTVQKILAWKDELIKKPLHKMNDHALEVEAVQAFKNLISFMGDRSSSKDTIGHAGKLLTNTVHAPEELRDEVFCQIVKQTTLNPSAEATLKGWQLMAICAGTYPPSQRLEKYLMSYCDQHTRPTLPDGTAVHAGVKPYAQYCMMRIKKSMALGPRREVPTAMEIQAAMERQPVVIRVHLLDGHYKTIPAEAWTTIKELNAMVAKKLNVRDPTPFATFEVSSNDEERVLDDEDRVLDLLSYWQREFANTKKGRKAPTFQFVYKMRLFVDIPESDTAAIDLAYIQAVYDVTESRYPCTLEDCVTLAAIQAQERFDDYNGKSPFDEGLTDFLPAKYLKGEEAESEVLDEILKTYAKLKGYSGMEAKLNYLDYVRSWKIYGSAYFFVEPQNSRDFPTDVVLAINAKGILVVDPETKDFLAEYPYAEIVTWGHSAQTFVLIVGNLIRQTKLYFKTDQGAECNALVHAYVSKLLETSATTPADE